MKKEEKKKSVISKSLEKKLAGTQNNKLNNKENVFISKLTVTNAEKKEKEAKPSILKETKPSSIKESNKKPINLIETMNFPPPEGRPQASVPVKLEQSNKQKSNKLNKKDKEKAREEELIQERDEKVYPEYEAKVQRKFMKSLREKKEVSSRITPKVTEVYPVLKTTKEPTQKIKDKEGPVQEMNIDEM